MACSLVRRHRPAQVLGLVLLGLLLVQCAHPPAPAPISQAAPAQAASAAPQTPGLFLYAAEKDGVRSHLMGTIHMGFGFAEVLSEDAGSRFEQARAVMLEMQARPDDAMRLIQAAQLPPDRSLKALVSEDTWRALVDQLGQTVPPPVLDRLKPWMPAVMLGVAQLEAVLDERRPGASAHRMDVELMQAAQEQGKPLLYLETIDQQIAIFESIPQEEQIRELAHSLAEGGKQQAEALLGAFAAGDEAALSAALFDEMQVAEAPHFFEAVLFERNARWLPLIEQEHAAGGVFVAVGAAHLFGERGLLQALATRGYEVRRVGFETASLEDTAQTTTAPHALPTHVDKDVPDARRHRADDNSAARGRLRAADARVMRRRRARYAP